MLWIAIPVLHSSGGWIIATGGSYVAGTFAWSWLGAFILGNAGWLSGLGLVSVAGLAGATGALSAVASGAALSLGAGLTSVGLGGVATYLGIAPATTFLGLTPAGWIAAGTTAVVAVVAGWFLVDGVMEDINAERAKGGLPPISVYEIVEEVRNHEEDSLKQILLHISEERSDVSVTEEHVVINGVEYPIDRVRYVINSDGSEALIGVSYMVMREEILQVSPPVEGMEDEDGWLAKSVDWSRDVAQSWFAQDTEALPPSVEVAEQKGWWQKSVDGIARSWPWSAPAQ